NYSYQKNKMSNEFKAKALNELYDFKKEPQDELSIEQNGSFEATIQTNNPFLESTNFALGKVLETLNISDYKIPSSIAEEQINLEPINLNKSNAEKHDYLNNMTVDSPKTKAKIKERKAKKISKPIKFSFSGLALCLILGFNFFTYLNQNRLNENFTHQIAYTNAHWQDLKNLYKSSQRLQAENKSNKNSNAKLINKETKKDTLTKAFKTNLKKEKPFHSSPTNVPLENQTNKNTHKTNQQSSPQADSKHTNPVIWQGSLSELPNYQADIERRSKEMSEILKSEIKSNPKRKLSYQQLFELSESLHKPSKSVD
ncbi:MAG: hypothetical protein SFU25_09605, partial [Candidatus Caenarcaniphilales bacterium]|nr:hypothetical protein [Candidatus Caenarcaniphilales bacterium]